MPMKTTQGKFVHELADLYDAEHQFLQGQHHMHAQARDPKLKSMIHEHIGESEQQIKNLEQVFSALGEKPKRQPCDGAKGILSEGRKAMEEAAEPALRDTMITGSGAKVEHYEMVSYGDLIRGAELMGKSQIVKLLEINREQEVRTARRMERASASLLRKAMQAEEK
jgi:ferritin-like metal-binding protein YciE